MLAVPDAARATAWYQEALGATELWNLGSVVGLSVSGAPLFLAEPEANGWSSPADIGTTTVRVEVFVDDPDTFIARAVAAGAAPRGPVRIHQMPWGPHRQGGFVDPLRPHLARRRLVAARGAPSRLNHGFQAPSKLGPDPSVGSAVSLRSGPSRARCARPSANP
jgi:uncharacterized glyoxalase superfamily protein PhnB